MTAPIFEELVDVIGSTGASVLASEKGGQRIYIPVSVDDDHWLAKLLGRAAADKLCGHFCHTRGMQIIVPIGDGSNRALRRRTVEAMLDDGASINDIASALAISYTTAKYHVARAKRKPHAPSLPDLFSQDAQKG